MTSMPHAAPTRKQDAPKEVAASSGAFPAPESLPRPQCNDLCGHSIDALELCAAEESGNCYVFHSPQSCEGPGNVIDCNMGHPVRQWMDEGMKVPMCTARPCWKSISIQTMEYKNRLHKIQINMPDIIHLDEKNKMVRVEPMVSIGKLNDFLIRRGWTLPVVPELDDLTIGGLVMGGGIESTSHKYGLFQYICRAFEMVTADGSVVWTDEDNDPEYFCAIPFSYGTVGFLTAVDLDIIPYKPYIKLTYKPVYSLDEVVDEFTRVTNDPKVESVEGIMYNLNEGVIMNGVFTDDYEPEKLNQLGKWYSPWFYKHVETYLKDKKEGVEYIPTIDFYHRQNNAFFWLMAYIIPFANNPLFRYLFGWSMPPKFSLLKWLRKNLVPKEQNENFVCQDFGYELSALKASLKFVDEQTKVYPIWLCPTRHCIPEGLEYLSLFKRESVHVDVGIYGFSPIEGFEPEAYFGYDLSALKASLKFVDEQTKVYPIWLCPTRHCIPEGLEYLSPFKRESVHVDIGIYGISPIEGFEPEACQRRMERDAIDNGCYVALYAETQLTRSDFDEMFEFNLRNYDKLRKRMNCEKAFPHVYEKISKLGRS
eukprot:maker-scaffold608_size125128-snap-gene-0.16 protein:Tk06791 transcript:maker-scaffold608_size125128-snap-gene-0.16-mRNA-1 annotation:"delta -sterol reductase"